MKPKASRSFKHLIAKMTSGRSFDYFCFGEIIFQRRNLKRVNSATSTSPFVDQLLQTLDIKLIVTLRDK